MIPRMPKEKIRMAINPSRRKTPDCRCSTEAHRGTELTDVVIQHLRGSPASSTFGSHIRFAHGGYHHAQAADTLGAGTAGAGIARYVDCHVGCRNRAERARPVKVTDVRLVFHLHGTGELPLAPGLP